MSRAQNVRYNGEQRNHCVSNSFIRSTSLTPGQIIDRNCADTLRPVEMMSVHAYSNNCIAINGITVQAA